MDASTHRVRRRQKHFYMLKGGAPPVWLSWLGVVLQTERWPICFPVRAQTWVVGSVPSWACMRANRLIFLSHINVFLPLLLPLFLSLYNQE